MKEKHFAYKVNSESSGLICSHAEFEEDKMLTLLQEITEANVKGIYWIFKQLENQEKEPLCIIDCYHHRIYYHYSGDVEDLSTTMNKLSKKI